ncbi:MAG TPA: fasciclin domain-containing protein [Leptolyngbyaceae cyanobacterium M33_DOE_097]|uniref:Fasciclin domain-containing protein n=1 Tax=Oscillatoriales cyanobacterium SpSt-418 TaxID=2282169 RepID=A0A7C3KH23_9CYAN|nr:fasciclin domain-containing protein [Leptolyngbyaceae cyanobacterium M33_DOE_097]
MTFTPNTFISKRFPILVGIAAGALFGAPAIAQGYQTPTEAQQSPTNTQMQQPTTNQAAPTDNTIVGVASGSQSFKTLTQAIQAAGLTDLLSEEGPYTVFAPTDEAFAQLPDGALQFLLLPENRDLLRQVLAYHVVPREVASNQIKTGAIKSIGGGLAVRVTSDNRVIVNNASVIQPDIQANNGVIHAVNRVLLPETLQRQLASRLGVRTIY